MERPVVFSRSVVEELCKELDALAAPLKIDLPVVCPTTEPLRTAEALAHLNRSWVLDTRPSLSATGRFARSRNVLKRIVSRLVIGTLERYFLEERAFLENLVRLENRLVERTDDNAGQMRSIARAVDDIARCVEWVDERGEILHRLLDDKLQRLREVSTDSR